MALLAFAAIASPEGVALAQPAGQEVLFWYEVNRARHDPPAWAVERGIDDVTGGDGQPSDLQDVVPRPPLAWSGALHQSSRTHADEMAANDYCAHVSPVTMETPNELVLDAGYPLWSLLTGLDNTVESIACGGVFDSALHALEALVVDDGFANLGHRVHLLGQDDFAAWDEAAVGLAVDPGSAHVHHWVFHSARRDVLQPRLTGVVYDDGNGNGLYDAGEGLSGVGVGLEGGASTTSNAGGAWSLPVGAGSHVVECSGGGFSGAARVAMEVAAFNRQVDCLSGQEGGRVDFVAVPAPPAWGGALAAAAAESAVARRRKG